MGCWKNFDDLEDNLILDELILLNDAIFAKDKEDLKINSTIHGFSLPDDDEDQIDEEPLDSRILEMEREYHRKKEEQGEENSKLNEFSDMGLGFSTVNSF